MGPGRYARRHPVLVRPQHRIGDCSNVVRGGGGSLGASSHDDGGAHRRGGEVFATGAHLLSPDAVGFVMLVLGRCSSGRLLPAGHSVKLRWHAIIPVGRTASGICRARELFIAMCRGPVFYGHISPHLPLNDCRAWHGMGWAVSLGQVSSRFTGNIRNGGVIAARGGLATQGWRR